MQTIRSSRRSSAQADFTTGPVGVNKPQKRWNDRRRPAQGGEPGSRENGRAGRQTAATAAVASRGAGGDGRAHRSRDRHHSVKTVGSGGTVSGSRRRPGCMTVIAGFSLTLVRPGDTLNYRPK
jgi:hypothetical protein